MLELNTAGTITAINTYGAAGLTSRRANSASTFYAFDNQGSVAERLDSSGAVNTHSVYDAYGAFNSTASPTDPFGYAAQAGYFTDTETGLVALAFRYYDPSTGRFLNRDPIGVDGGINVYGYVGNGPSGGVDALGQSRGTMNSDGSYNCDAVRQKIRNLEDLIEAKCEAVRLNPKRLIYRVPGEVKQHWKSIWGHEEDLKKYIDQLQKWRDILAENCPEITGDPQLGTVPVRVRAPNTSVEPVEPVDPVPGVGFGPIEGIDVPIVEF